MLNKKYLIPVLVATTVVFLIYSQRGSIAGKILERGLAVNLATNNIGELQDGLHVALCGAGGPLPAPNASGPCVAVITGQKFFVVDVGTDSPRNLGRMGYPPGNVDAVLLTHFHSDHIDGLGELATLRWAGGDFKMPLPVYGPTGVETVVDGFNRAYSQDFGYRHEHHGDLVAPIVAAGMQAKGFAKPAEGSSVKIIDEGDLRIEAFTVTHTPVDPAVGYKFTYKDRTVVISGDTVKSSNLEQFAQGADLLVHEALAPNLVAMMNEAARKIGNPILEKITVDIPDYHASPVDTAESARDANVGHLLYYHIVPPLLIPGQKTLFLDGAEEIFENYTIGVDGVAFSLPAGSKEIIQTSDSLRR